MSRVPYYGRGYYTTQMRTAQQNVTTCKLPISPTVEKIVRETLRRENTSIKSMLSAVLDRLMVQPTKEWESLVCGANHSWTIAASKEAMTEFRRMCKNVGLDWRGVLSFGLFDYMKHEYRLTLPDTELRRKVDHPA